MSKRLHLILIFLVLYAVSCTSDAPLDTVLPMTSELEIEIEYIAYVPLVINDVGLFAMSAHDSINSTEEGLIRELQPSHVRLNLYWYRVETSPGVYEWPDKSEDFAILEDMGADVWMTVKMAPRWAREIPQIICSRIKTEYIDDFADFAAAASEQYPEVKYWEIWNEPDAATGVEYYYGCWGDEDEDYYGGEYYGSVIAPVYDALKAVDVTDIVVHGGLMLSCVDCPMADYLEGTIVGGAKFDAVSFHYYCYVGMSPEECGSELDDRIVHLMSLTDKPLHLTETSYLCNPEWTGCPDPYNEAAKWHVFYQTYQPAYAPVMKSVVRSYARVLSWEWYTVQASGWMNCAASYRDGSPRPVYWELFPQE